MPKIRIDRVNEEIAKAISDILPTVKDPRIAEAGMISVTHVDTSGDFSLSKIYISIFPTNGQAVNPKEIRAGLKSSTGYIRRELAARVRLRISPELQFILDDSIAHGAKILEMIEQVNADTNSVGD